MVAVVVSQFNLSLPQTLEDFSQRVSSQYSQGLSINSSMSNIINLEEYKKKRKGGFSPITEKEQRERIEEQRKEIEKQRRIIERMLFT